MVSYDLLLQGFPGRSTTHGFLGWPSLALIRAGGKKVLFDTGHMGQHRLLLQRLAEKGVEPTDVDIVVMSHSHWDHTLGYPLFPNAEMVIGRRELEWALSLAPGENLSVPVYLLQHLAEHPRLRTVEDNTELLPGLLLIDSPGHTPGHISMVLQTEAGRVVLAQDAIKNRAEFLSRQADQTMDAAASSASIERMASIADLVIPGHDRSFVVRDGRVEYIEELRAEIMVRVGPSLDEETLFGITLR